MKLRYVMMILVILLLVGAASAWLDGYDYRRFHNILGSSAGDQTNYQMKFVVFRGVGETGGEKISISPDKCKADFSDIRFTTTTAEDTPLDYWIESRNATTAIFWVEVPMIANGMFGAGLYVYYGNPGATDASNGDATFLFFDHFEGTTLNTGKWTILAGSPVIANNSEVTLPNAARIASLTTYNGNIELINRVRYPSLGGGNFNGFWHSTINDRAYFAPYNMLTRTRNDGVNTDNPLLGITYADYNIYRIAWLSSNVKFYVNDILKNSHTTNLPNQGINHYFEQSSGGSTIVDYTFIKKYISPEPEHSEWHNEEDNIPNDNIIMPSEMPFTITQALVDEVGPRFELGGNWTGAEMNTYAISIQAPNVILDGNQYTITGTIDRMDETYQNAIRVGNVNNVTVYHVNVTGWNHGICYETVDSGIITQNNLYGNYNSSICISSSNRITVAGNILTNNGENGIYAGHSTNIIVIGDNNSPDGNSPVLTDISRNPIGITFDHVNHGQISGYADGLGFEMPGRASDNLIGAFIIGCNDIRVNNFLFSGNDVAGVVVEESSNIIIEDHNVFDGNDIGMVLRNSAGCSVENNLIEHNMAHGIEITGAESYCTDITVSGNTIRENNQGDKWCDGIHAFQSKNLTFIGNNLINSGKNGLNIGSCENVTVRANYLADHLSPISNPGYGIVLSYCKRADTMDNVLMDNTIGIWYHESTFNYIMNNSVGNEISPNGCGIGLVEGSGKTGDPECPYKIPYSITLNTVSGYSCGIAFENVENILIFNNIFRNSNNFWIGSGTEGISWNVPKNDASPGTNIIGGQYYGGNYWAQPNGYGWSQVADDTDQDGICDEPYIIDATLGYADEYPLGGFNAYFTADPAEGIKYGGDPVVVQFIDRSTGEIDSWTWSFGDGTTSNEQSPSHSYANIGVYPVTLVVQNAGTGRMDQYQIYYYIRAAIPTGVQIWQGWNFVSTPRTLAAGSNTVEEVFGDVDMGGQQVYYYDANALPEPQWVIMGEDDLVQPLDGIWIYSTKVGPFVPFNYDMEFAGKTPRVKHLVRGWNAIGMGSVHTMNTSAYLSPLGDNWDVLVDFSSALQAFNSPHIRTVQTYTMYPTSGYWIYMNDEADLLALTG